MRLTILGCSGSFPGPGGACSGYLVQAGDLNIVLDLGPGCLANLQKHLALEDLDAVVLTHRHPDHWTDLAGLRVALKYGSGVEGLRVFGTADTHATAEALCDGVAPTFDWEELANPGPIDLGAVRLTFSRTDHYVETYAVRVDELASGRSLVYSADTGPAWTPDALGPGIDLLLCEATYAHAEDAPGVLHLTAAQAAEAAAEAGVSKLVLTHLLPRTDAGQVRSIASRVFAGEVDMATIDGRYEL